MITNELLTVLADRLHNLSPEDLKRVIQSVNEYEALCRVAELAREFAFNTSLPTQPLFDAIDRLNSIRSNL